MKLIEEDHPSTLPLLSSWSLPESGGGGDASPGRPPREAERGCCDLRSAAKQARSQQTHHRRSHSRTLQRAWITPKTEADRSLDHNMLVGDLDSIVLDDLAPASRLLLHERGHCCRILYLHRKADRF